MQGGGIEYARVQTTVSGTMHSPECLQHYARQPDRMWLPSALPSMRGERSGSRKRGGCPPSTDAPGERGPAPTSAHPSKDFVRRTRLPSTALFINIDPVVTEGGIKGLLIEAPWACSYQLHQPMPFLRW